MEQIALIICFTVFFSIIAINMTVFRCIEAICNKDKPIIKKVIERPPVEPVTYKWTCKEYKPKEVD